MDFLKDYNPQDLTIASLGGHSALDVCHGAKKHGFKTLVVAQKGREKVYETYFRRCVDETLVLKKFQDVLNEDVQKKLRERNTIFVHNRYFWVYFDDFSKVESDFHIPIFGSRHFLKFEERGEEYNQYHLLKDAGIRTPRVFKKPQDIDCLCIVKANEAKRSYERGYFLVDHQYYTYDEVGSRLEKEGKIAPNWRSAPIEEFIVGAPVNFNYFYSPLTGALELLGTDMRRQTNLDGFLRMLAVDQSIARTHMPLKMIETGHIAVTVKESLLEKAFELGEKFVAECKKIPAHLDPAQKGMIGPFALQGAVVAEEGKEEIVIFDVSFRIPGSPGTFATPYSRYLYGETMSMGERIGMELEKAAQEGCLEEVIT